MNFAVNMYFGDLAGREKNKIKSEFRRHKSQIGVYAVVLSEKPDDLLEIIPAWELNNKTYWKYHKDDFNVVGMAITKTEAKYLAEKIIMDVLESTGDFDLNNFFAFKYR